MTEVIIKVHIQSEKNAELLALTYYKSLAEEKFKWPKHSDEVVTLTGQQLNWLLDGYDITLMKGHKKLEYESLF